MKFAPTTKPPKNREKTKSQFLKKNTELVSGKIVSADGFWEIWWFFSI